MQCVGCGSPRVVNKKYGLCDDCNYARLHGKTKIQVRLEKQKVKLVVKGGKNAVKKSYIKKVTVKHQKIVKADRDTYFEVFNSQPHYCAECGAPLPTEFLDEQGRINCIGQYSHILGKKAYPEFRHVAKNFNRLCPDPCHNRWEFKDKENMNIYKKNLITIQELYDEQVSGRGR